MPQKFVVRAPDRKNSGHPGTYRGGRFFPGGEDKTIEVLDQDECPMLEERSGNQTRRFLDPDRVGRKAWELIVKDDTISKRPFGAPLFADPAKTSELDALKAKIAELEGELSKAKALADSRENELNTQVAIIELLTASAKAGADKIAELETLLESVTATKPEGEATKAEYLPKPKSKSVK